MNIYPFIAFTADNKKTKFDDSFYEAMRHDFNQLYEKGYFKKLSEKPCFYILQITNGRRKSTGIITLTDIHEYIQGKIQKHEQTLQKKEKMHKALLTGRKAMIKPAALIMPLNKKIYTYLNAIQSNYKPTVQFKYPDNKTVQKLWIIDVPQHISSIQALFKNEIKKSIIADGHHRFASMASILQVDYRKILTAYFSVDQMEVLSFYRILSPLKNKSAIGLLDDIKNKCTSWKKVKSIPKVNNDGFYFIYNKEIYAFTLKKSKKDLWVHAFQRIITHGVFGIKNETTSRRVAYEDSIMSTAEFKTMLDLNKDKFIFKLPLLSPEQVLHTQKLLPPKSTYFLPRIINGIVIKVI